MNDEMRASLANRIRLIKASTESLREGIFERNRAASSQSRPIAEGNLELHWKYSPYSDVFSEYKTLQKRRIDCAVFEDGKKVMAADFMEFRAVEAQRDDNFFWEMDAPNGEICAMGTAFLSGWDSSELDEHGGFAVLNHLAADPKAGVRGWAPLLSQFIDKHIFRSSFVLLTDPYPHDVVNALDGLKGEEDSLERLARRRHDAKFRFCTEHLGFTMFGAEARSSRWMYRLDPQNVVQPEFLNFDFEDIGGSIRMPELYEGEEQDVEFAA